MLNQTRQEQLAQISLYAVGYLVLCVALFLISFAFFTLVGEPPR